MKDYKFGDEIFLRGVQYVFVAFSLSRNTVWVLDRKSVLKRFPVSWIKSSCFFSNCPVLPFVS